MLYIVHGSTGEYEDYRDWPVAAFTRKQRAETWARKANEWAIAHGLAGSTSWTMRENAPTNPYDPKARSLDYNGVHYVMRPSNHVPLDPPLPRG